jgi:hypothetical protein
MCPLTPPPENEHTLAGCASYSQLRRVKWLAHRLRTGSFLEPLPKPHRLNLLTRNGMIVDAAEG